MLVLEKLSYSFKDKKVLADVSFRLAAGEFMGVIGPNGAGKTTLLKNIAGILSPQEGNIILNNLTKRGISQKRWAQQVALLPQDFHTPFNFLVEDVVLMGRIPHSRGFFENDYDWEIVRQAMAATDVERFSGRALNTLSGGERQRVFIARALAQAPLLLLLDEPTASLDWKRQNEILELVSRLAKERGMMIIAAMHNINAALRHSDRMLLLKEGVTIGWGPPAEIITSETMQRIYETPLVVTKSAAGGLVVS
jgi:iron complex transport system ATP-binding protein